MDTTYFGRHFGVMVFMDNTSKLILYFEIISYETNEHYRQGVKNIQSKGIEIQSIICDERRGLLNSFPLIPVQMCQFHQL